MVRLRVESSEPQGNQQVRNVARREERDLKGSEIMGMKLETE